MDNLKNNEKYWAIKYYLNKRINIITAAGIIKGTVCNIDTLNENDKVANTHVDLYFKINEINLKPKDGNFMPSIDTTPILLSNVEINNKEFEYMLIFPDKIIGVSIDD